MHNANTETNQLKIFKELKIFLTSIKIIWIIFAGNFNIFFNSKLEAKESKPLSKRKSISKLVDIKERLDICDIWRIRNSKCQNVTVRQHHSIGFIERRADYIFISNCLQEFVNNTDVLPAPSTQRWI